MEYSTDLGRRVLLTLAGVALLLVVGLVLSQFLPTLVFTVFLYYASRPIYRRLGRLPLPKSFLKRAVPYQKQVHAAATIFFFLLPFVVLVGYTLVLVIPELQSFFGEGGLGAAYLSQFQELQGGSPPGPLADLGFSEVLAMGPAEVIDLLRNATVQSWLGRVSDTLIGSLSLLTSLLLRVFIMFAGTYYLLTDGPRLVGWFLDTFDGSGVLREYAAAVDEELSSILFGNILNALVTGVIGIFVFSLYNLVAPGSVQIPFAPLVGALTGIGSLIPVVGMKIVYLPVAVLLAVSAVVTGQTAALAWVALFLVVTLVVVDTIPDFLIRPYVSGDLTHVGLLMFAYILGPIAFGFYGIFLGPMLLVLAAQFFRIIVPYIITGTVETTQTSLSEYDSGES
ncbi:MULTISPECIES: AI-2E family transporter [Haloarcula]|jgi:predicted PurR-regulated permease PerM|uniref:AI-2E family transporter n=1 Tax=Haloarcula marismortui (strain ATCC 43049 / DSM 3752 / JCM 8966 / VKM B-1809) TaxID=272569 RepID=Q5V0R2_HALMA|nr:MULTISPECIES: AI-2E family transporter [Haloarcula]AAV46891.1 HTR-like protein [Haloarcula marismortui ATCC 43049]NHN61939.1 AI-2E family transporter [Haloarcula sp. JP-Z28]NHX40397.1 AI-2E family transporter [Haloarcula sp. R1-2]QCP91597.1 AI-2E family transporter [Haloarcula marismortui ATCC 43049]